MDRRQVNEAIQAMMTAMANGMAAASAGMAAAVQLLNMDIPPPPPPQAAIQQDHNPPPPPQQAPPTPPPAPAAPPRPEGKWTWTPAPQQEPTPPPPPAGKWTWTPAEQMPPPPPPPLQAPPPKKGVLEKVLVEPEEAQAANPPLVEQEAQAANPPLAPLILSPPGPSAGRRRPVAPRERPRRPYPALGTPRLSLPNNAVEVSQWPQLPTRELQRHFDGNGRRCLTSAGCAGKNASMRIKPGATTAWPRPALIRAPIARSALWSKTRAGIGLSAMGTVSPPVAGAQ